MVKIRSSAACLLALVLSLGISFAQGDVLLDDREKLYYRYFQIGSLVSGGTVEPHWMADGNSFWYAEGAPDNTVIYKIDPVANTKAPLFDTQRLREALEPVLGHEPPYEGLPFDNFSFVSEEKWVRFAVGKRDFHLNIESYEIRPAAVISAEEKKRTTPQRIRKGFASGEPDVMEVASPDGRWFALDKEHNIWLRSSKDNREEQLTADGVEDFEWTIEDAKWSPDSFKLAVSKVDSRGLAKIPVVHWLKTTEEVQFHPYTKSGGRMARTALHVIDLFSKDAVRVEGGGLPDHYYFIEGWRPDGSEFLFLRTDRECKKLELLAADPETGKSRIILTEESDTFIGGLALLVGWRGLLTPVDKDRFVWMSERDGWNHLYLYGYDGGLRARLTAGEFVVLAVVGIDADAGWVYFTAHAEERPYDTHLYRVDREGKGFQRLTEGSGQHSVKLSPSKDFFVDTSSGVEAPPRTELRTAEGELLQTLSEADTTGLEDMDWSAPEEFVVKAADGETDLFGVLCKPHDFDPQRKYPVLDHIYNGPQQTWVPRTFLNPIGTWAQALAQLGFLVMVVDGRGTPERGKAFQDVVYRNFGRHEIPDHVAALRNLAKDRPYMDLDRVGIFGGSWGGYMTIRAMVTHPEVYKVGVATNPVSDLYDHPSAAIEGYMGLPQDNREGYEYASSILLAGKLQGKLMIVHGTSDVNAPFSSTMKMVDALVKANKQHDLVILPGQDHAIRGTAARTYYTERLRKYLQRHLESDKVAFIDGE